MKLLSEEKQPLTIDKPLLDRLTELAKQSPRLRMHYDLRDSAEEFFVRGEFIRK